MAKDYKRGIDLKLYHMSSGSWSTPTWTEVNAAGDIDVNENPDDISFPVRGIAMGHLRGQSDPAINFTLAYDKGDASVTAIVDAMTSGDVITLAVADGPIDTTGTVYHKMECVLMGRAMTAPTSGPATFAVSAFRHMNSDYDLTEVTVSAP